MNIYSTFMNLFNKITFVSTVWVYRCIICICLYTQYTSDALWHFTPKCFMLHLLHNHNTLVTLKIINNNSLKSHLVHICISLVIPKMSFIASFPKPRIQFRFNHFSPIQLTSKKSSISKLIEYSTLWICLIVTSEFPYLFSISCKLKPYFIVQSYGFWNL